MEERLKSVPLEKLRPDKKLLKDLGETQMQWLRFLLIAETGIALLNTAVLMTGAAIYGKKTLEILRKKVEE